MVTVTLPAGANDSDTPNTSLVPCATENRPGATTSLPPDAAEVPAAVMAGPPEALAALVARPAQPSDPTAKNTALCHSRGRQALMRKVGRMRGPPRVALTGPPA